MKRIALAEEKLKTSKIKEDQIKTETNTAVTKKNGKI